MATLVLRRGREVVLELQFERDVDWDPASFEQLRLASGDAVGGQVDAARTTRAARLGRGQRARITLVLAADTDAAIVELVFAGFTLPVQVK